MSWLIQGIITTIICSVCGMILKYIFDVQDNNSKIKQNSIILLRFQIYGGFIILIILEYIVISCNDYLKNHLIINGYLYILIATFFLIFIGGVNSVFKEICYYRNNKISNKHAKNK